ncbi:hypothetical protein Q5752_006074 [Cryptotrichosporon argae]
MSTGYSIHVSGLAPETSEDKLNDFFSFCGKLVSVKKAGSEADITFEKLSAMRTALMLNGGTLDGAHLNVSSTSPEAEPKSVLPTGATGATPIGASDSFTQEDKPKAAIVAEYLAHGYVLGDHIIQKAIDLDHKQGISSRFLGFVSTIDQKVGEKVVGENQTVSGKAAEHAATLVAKTREVDQSRGVSAKFHEYYSKALGTPVGQKVSSFYTQTQKQVLDVHEEAKRIAAEKKAAGGTPTASTPTTATDPAAPAPASASASASAVPEKATVADLPPTASDLKL